jgi:hypothetical protein
VGAQQAKVNRRDPGTSAPCRETFGHEALGRFLYEDWPVCCGEIVMGFLQPRDAQPN